jgi:enoyl-CoA hydratase/carnithine racemase
MTPPLVNASKHKGVMVLELSNPPANTYSYEMMKELDSHVLDARFDESVHVLLITRRGREVLLRGRGHRHARKGGSPAP